MSQLTSRQNSHVQARMQHHTRTHLKTLDNLHQSLTICRTHRLIWRSTEKKQVHYESIRIHLRSSKHLQICKELSQLSNITLSEIARKHQAITMKSKNRQSRIRRDTRTMWRLLSHRRSWSLTRSMSKLKKSQGVLKLKRNLWLMRSRLLPVTMMTKNTHRTSEREKKFSNQHHINRIILQLGII